jgi:hypothetical protein
VGEVAALAAAVVLTAAPASAADVTLVGPGGRVGLSEVERAAIADVVKRETESCSLNSVGYPDVFRAREGSDAWRHAEGQPHLYVRYDTPLVVRGGGRGGAPVLASEVLIGTGDPKFIHQPITRHDGAVVLHGKCGGLEAIELMCLPALRPSFPETTRANCHLVERSRRRPP